MVLTLMNGWDLTSTVFGFELFFSGHTHTPTNTSKSITINATSREWSLLVNVEGAPSPLSYSGCIFVRVSNSWMSVKYGPMLIPWGGGEA